MSKANTFNLINQEENFPSFSQMFVRDPLMKQDEVSNFPTILDQKGFGSISTMSYDTSQSKLIKNGLSENCENSFCDTILEIDPFQWMMKEIESPTMNIDDDPSLNNKKTQILDDIDSSMWEFPLETDISGETVLNIGDSQHLESDLAFLWDGCDFKNAKTTQDIQNLFCIDSNEWKKNPKKGDLPHGDLQLDQSNQVHENSNKTNEISFGSESMKIDQPKMKKSTQKSGNLQKPNKSNQDRSESKDCQLKTLSSSISKALNSKIKKILRSEFIKESEAKKKDFLFQNSPSLYKLMSLCIIKENEYKKRDFPIINEMDQTVGFSHTTYFASPDLPRLCETCGIVYKNIESEFKQCKLHNKPFVSKDDNQQYCSRCCRSIHSNPCHQYDYHFSQTKSMILGFQDVRTWGSLKSNSGGTIEKVVVLQCGVIYTVDGFGLGRLHLTSSNGKVLIDYHCKPASLILQRNYNSKKDNRPTVDFDYLHQKMMKFISSETIIIGHRLPEQLIAAKIYHDRIVDTYELFVTDMKLQQLSAGGLYRQHLNLEHPFLDSKNDLYLRADVILELAKASLSLKHSMNTCS